MGILKQTLREFLNLSKDITKIFRSKRKKLCRKPPVNPTESFPAKLFSFHFKLFFILIADHTVSAIVLRLIQSLVRTGNCLVVVRTVIAADPY